MAIGCALYVAACSSGAVYEGSDAGGRGGTLASGGGGGSSGEDSSGRGGTRGGGYGGYGGQASDDPPAAGAGGEALGGAAGAADGGAPSAAGSAGEGGAGGAGAAGGAGDSEPCLADGTPILVWNNLSLVYVLEIDGDPTGAANPTLRLCRGNTYYFDIIATGHPFFIKTSRAIGATDAYDQGVLNNGIATGHLVFAVFASAPDVLYYQCAVHPAMGGTIEIVTE